MKPYLEQLRAWWSALAPREQKIVGAGGFALALILLYLALWEPLGKARHSRERELAEARALATQIETLGANRGAAPAAVTGAGQSLLTVVDQSAKASTLKPWSTLKPDGDSTVRISFEDIPFDKLVRWLNDLQVRYGVRVDNADIDRQATPGLVNARVTLMR